MGGGLACRDHGRAHPRRPQAPARAPWPGCSASGRPQVLDELLRFPPEVSQALAADLPGGRLRPETVAALEAQTDAAVELLRTGSVTEGLVRLGGLLRIPADLSDPVLAVGPEGCPPGLTREYYAFVDANLGQIPVVLDDPAP